MEIFLAMAFVSPGCVACSNKTASIAFSPTARRVSVICTGVMGNSGRMVLV